MNLIKRIKRINWEGTLKRVAVLFPVTAALLFQFLSINQHNRLPFVNIFRSAYAQNFFEDESESSQDDEDYIDLTTELLSKNAIEMVSLVPRSKLENLEDNFFFPTYKILSEMEISISKRTAIADFVVLQKLYDMDLFANKNVETNLKNIFESDLEIFKDEIKEKYDEDEYKKLRDGSKFFASSGKNTGDGLLERVISIKDSLILKSPPILYNGVILIVLEDFYLLSSAEAAEIEYMENNATVVIKLDSYIIEIEKGQTKSYSKDKEFDFSVPVLSFMGATYVPLAEFANLNGFNSVSLPLVGAAVIY
ncbi:MAG: copper amine oxidase N-terminal domain-containing protein [Oscillospiraceae bacterium]|nr:copper amine oxidase N-terminal domain-containing protein [Oscillospiraceae bacterium]